MSKTYGIVKSEETNFSYEATEATKALAKEVPIFITGTFNADPKSLSNEYALTCGGGRVLKIEKEEDFELVKAAVDLITQQLKNAERTQPVLFIVSYKNDDENHSFKKKVIEKFKEWDVNFIIRDLELLKRSGDFKKAVEEAIEAALDRQLTESNLNQMNLSKSLASWRAYLDNTLLRKPIKTGFNKLDDALGGGLLRGRLYCLGATSSLGKTTLALNIANDISEHEENVLFFSLEMSKYELMTKLISMETLKHCLNNTIEIEEHAQTALHLTTNPNYNEVLDESINNFTNKCEHLYISEGIGDIGVLKIRDSINKFTQTGRSSPVVFIDYVQLLAPFGDRLTDKQSMDKNILELKRISRDYDIPVIAISSFNRSSYLYEANFESFKESGAIEYSSDVLLGLELNIDRTGWATTKNDAKKFDEKHQQINEAKIKYPREVKLVILKNRLYKAWSKVVFDYYTYYDYFKEQE